MTKLLLLSGQNQNQQRFAQSLRISALSYLETNLKIAPAKPSKIRTIIEVCTLTKKSTDFESLAKILS
ncbi:MAG: hypothetical protein K2X81_25930, partial [Candidatus Obscuribacterales bacterium]|nr:hypothetical protein [Candidatus Obscuribacterales bacterium]